MKKREQEGRTTRQEAQLQLSRWTLNSGMFHRFRGGEGVHWREFGNAKLRVGCDHHKREGAIKQEVVQ